MTNNISPFIEKLQQILNDPNNEDIIKYSEQSSRLEIFNKKKLENILSKYFRHGRFQSFVRQLNWYGFYKINNKCINCYSHPDLERGMKLSEIKSRRKTITQRRIEQNHSVHNEPFQESPKIQIQENKNLASQLFFEQKVNLFPRFQMGNNFFLIDPHHFNIMPVSNSTQITFPYQNLMFFYK